MVYGTVIPYESASRPAYLLACNLKVLELDRDHPAAHYFAAVAYLAQNQVGAAERHLGRAMELGHQPPQDFLRALEKAQKKTANKATVLEIAGAEAPENAKED